MVWTERILPFILNISSSPLKIAAHRALTQLTKPKTCYNLHMLSLFILQEKIGGVNPLLIFAYIAYIM